MEEALSLAANHHHPSHSTSFLYTQLKPYAYLTQRTVESGTSKRSGHTEKPSKHDPPRLSIHPPTFHLPSPSLSPSRSHPSLSFFLPFDYRTLSLLPTRFRRRCLQREKTCSDQASRAPMSSTSAPSSSSPPSRLPFVLLSLLGFLVGYSCQLGFSVSFILLLEEFGLLKAVCWRVAGRGRGGKVGRARRWRPPLAKLQLDVSVRRESEI